MFEMEKLFWAPGATWCLTEEGLEIDQFVFQGKVTELFPAFYYLCSHGVTFEDLKNAFPTYPGIKLRKFMKSLMRLGVLVETIQNTDGVFASQGNLFQSEQTYPEDYFMNRENLEAFVEQQLTREMTGTESAICLEQITEPDYLQNRRSVRKFDQKTEISFQKFSAVMHILHQIDRDGKRAYYYPSAGGLYPIDFFVHVKKGRVEGVPEGLYAYQPIQHGLYRISDGLGFHRDMHYFLNKEIYDTSAFSVYLFYNAEVNMPKYGAKGYYYGMLDAGIAIGYLTLAAEKSGISLCSIGDMKFDEIADLFPIQKNQKYLHCIEFGLADREERNGN